MGLSSSKAHPKVTKVAPMRVGEDLPTLAAPYRLPGVLGEPSLHPPATAEWGKPTFHRELPPLRETWYGRAAAGPLAFNTVPEKGETSIIKQHPPRRPQRLEPAGPPQAIIPAEPWSQQEVAASPKMKALEKRGQSLRHLPGRRQHLHKLQMLDLIRRRREHQPPNDMPLRAVKTCSLLCCLLMTRLQTQAELKQNLHREAKINKQKIKEFSPKKVLDTLQRGNSAESQDLVPAEHNQHFHGDDHGNTWGGGLSRQHDGAELSPGRSRKVDLWFCREPQMRDLFWDTSSTGSEEWEGEEKIYHKPRLVRTKTERVSLFDDFFDRDF
ncbi:factor associated with metabolism and energy isoform X1 [Strix uralensis]|uniref:factor associated with metabolism and energy isoform X1 n=1 Tax=Strix uralensis TaxID=36305 RepID=UPI003DA790F2